MPYRILCAFMTFWILIITIGVFQVGDQVVENSSVYQMVKQLRFQRPQLLPLPPRRQQPLLRERPLSAPKMKQLH